MQGRGSDGSVSDGVLSGNVTARSGGGDENPIGLATVKDVSGLCMCLGQEEHAIVTASFSEEVLNLLLPVQQRQGDVVKECEPPTLEGSVAGANHGRTA